MSCNNCFNGCATIVSDKCVKYTGVNIPALGIENGDSLYSVENSIITNLLTALDGTGIIPDLSATTICSLVDGYLPVSGDITIVDYVSALIQTACALEDLITTNTAAIAVIEADYTVGCLPTVTASSGTHAILQAVITYLCTLNTTVTALALDLSTNYTTTADLPALISSIIVTEPETTLLKNRMIPMTIVEYYGSVANFDGSGAGIGDWEEIYLCNGNNGTPDKRGRVGIGATTGMGGGAMSPVVDPVVAGNPAYTLSGTGGANVITLTTAQMPQHTHAATFVSPPHTHTFPDLYSAIGFVDNEVLSNGSTIDNIIVDETDPATVTGTVTNAVAGNGESHSNIQPVLACYYIMYIPV